MLIPSIFVSYMCMTACECNFNLFSCWTENYCVYISFVGAAVWCSCLVVDDVLDASIGFVVLLWSIAVRRTCLWRTVRIFVVWQVCIACAAFLFCFPLLMVHVWRGNGRNMNLTFSAEELSDGPTLSPANMVWQTSKANFLGFTTMSFVHDCVFGFYLCHLCSVVLCLGYT